MTGSTSDNMIGRRTFICSSCGQKVVEEKIVKARLPFKTDRLCTECYNYTCKNVQKTLFLLCFFIFIVVFIQLAIDMFFPGYVKLQKILDIVYLVFAALLVVYYLIIKRKRVGRNV